MKKIFVLSLICFLLVGCANKEVKNVISYEDFYNTGINNNYTVIDNISDYSDKSYITNAYKATLDDITIEFITYTDSETAEKVLESHIESFNLLKSTMATVKNIKGSNFHKYMLISNNYYMTSNRIDNTLVFTKTNLTNKDKVETFLNSIGY